VLFGSTILWLVYLFHHSEKSLKARPGLCVKVISHLLDNATLKVTRQRFVYCSEDFKQHN